jgi:hypothetical protein
VAAVREAQPPTDQPDGGQLLEHIEKHVERARIRKAIAVHECDEAPSGGGDPPIVGRREAGVLGQHKYLRIGRGPARQLRRAVGRRVVHHEHLLRMAACCLLHRRQTASDDLGVVVCHHDRAHVGC